MSGFYGYNQNRTGLISAFIVFVAIIAFAYLPVISTKQVCTVSYSGTVVDSYVETNGSSGLWMKLSFGLANYADSKRYVIIDGPGGRRKIESDVLVSGDYYESTSCVRVSNTK